MLGDSALFSGRAGAKGLAKGTGKGKLKGMPGQQLALEDEKNEKSDAQLLLEAQNKGKKMRDIAFCNTGQLRRLFEADKALQVLVEGCSERLRDCSPRVEDGC
jgi:hypothetical protein